MSATSPHVLVDVVGDRPHSSVGSSFSLEERDEVLELVASSRAAQGLAPTCASRSFALVLGAVLGAAS